MVGWVSGCGVVERLLSFAARALREVTAWLRFRSDNPLPRRGGRVVTGDGRTSWECTAICEILATTIGTRQR
jgi:hypothetical protein